MKDRQFVGLDTYSLCTSKLSIYRHDRPADPVELAIGTGFFYKYGSQRYLVTNWHNVTGIDFQSGKSISSTGARPTNFAVRFVTNDSRATLYLNLGLYDEKGDPAWLIDPNSSRKVDVLAIPLPTWPKDSINTFIGDIEERDLQISVGVDVFIIGFPQGIDRGLAPLWKKGSLAVDPDTANNLSKPYWLIDCASRKGMSGSPVVIRRFSPFEDESGNVFSRGHGTRFIGIYSGRFEDKDPLGAHLGIVWPRELLQEIVVAGVFDRSLSR
ncbi:trypsin-like peptidase domain-containing protein [Parasphingorhabdus sp.]|uniref:trypsin-like peptidase domain-containing protein n=1 Tax=Parasphingorhabdus sp. TaxID=2709688 RepID=UPI003001EAB8